MSKENCCTNKLKLCAGGSIVIAGVVIAMSLVWTGSANPLEYFVPIDPPGASEAVRWDAEEGLELAVLNACEDYWEPFFDRSVREWNQTEALILKPSRVAYEYDCTPAWGKLKVCNGDYGDTNWKGINEIFMQRNISVYSVARLNDYHLTDDITRRYTMCHELGHGWGLPHTDEDYFNRDSGNCMDYTRNPGNNLLPGKFNLDLLVDLYGTPGSPRIDPATTETPGPEEQTTPFNDQGSNLRPPSQRDQNQRPQNYEDDEEEDEKKEKKKKEKKDDRRRRHLQREFEHHRGLISEEVEACEADVCRFELGDGLSVEIHKLLV